MILRIGSLIPGFCGGVFGRDSHEGKRVEAMGQDWVVCRDKEGQIHFASGENVISDIENWCNTFYGKI